MNIESYLKSPGVLGNYFDNNVYVDETVANAIYYFMDVLKEIKRHKRDPIKCDFNDVIKEIENVWYKDIISTFRREDISRMRLLTEQAKCDSKILDDIFMYLQMDEENYDFTDCCTLSCEHSVIDCHNKYISQIKQFLWTELFLPKWIGVHQCIEWHPHKGIMQEQYNSILIT
jgi:hypothetical protein